MLLRSATRLARDRELPEFKPGQLTLQEYAERKGRCTSHHLSLLVSSSEFRQLRKVPGCSQSGFIASAKPQWLAIVFVLCALVSSIAFQANRSQVVPNDASTVAGQTSTDVLAQQCTGQRSLHAKHLVLPVNSLQASHQKVFQLAGCKAKDANKDMLPSTCEISSECATGTTFVYTSCWSSRKHVLHTQAHPYQDYSWLPRHTTNVVGNKSTGAEGHKDGSDASAQLRLDNVDLLWTLARAPTGGTAMHPRPIGTLQSPVTGLAIVSIIVMSPVVLASFPSPRGAFSSSPAQGADGKPSQKPYPIVIRPICRRNGMWRWNKRHYRLSLTVEHISVRRNQVQLSVLVKQQQ